MATQVNNSVLKAFAILELFSESRTEINAALVARELGLNAVTAHRFLRTLERVGALVAVSKGVYRLGFALVDLADRVIHHADLGRALTPLLEAVTREIGRLRNLGAMQREGTAWIIADVEAIRARLSSGDKR